MQRPTIVQNGAIAVRGGPHLGRLMIEELVYWGGNDPSIRYAMHYLNRADLEALRADIDMVLREADAKESPISGDTEGGPL